MIPLSSPVQLQCKVCGSPISQAEARVFGQWLGSDFAGRMCVKCRLKWKQDLKALEQHINMDDQGQRCDDCGDDLDTIAARQNGRAQMYLQIRDGVLQFNCFLCSYRYSMKATNLYKSTLFGWRNKLK